eukprot:3167322-Pyramimonas_sp.AAC.1
MSASLGCNSKRQKHVLSCLSWEKGSKGVNQRLALHESGCEVVSEQHAIKVKVNVAKQIKGLGAALVENGGASGEARLRTSEMRRELRPIQASLGRRKALPIPARLNDAFAMSKLWYTVSTWEPLPQRVHNRLANAQTTAYRASFGEALGANAEGHVSNKAALKQVQRLEHKIAMIISRFRYLP